MALFDLSHFVEHRRDFFDTQAECKKNAKAYRQTNPKFKKFDQSLYTAGDEQDFSKYALLQFMCMVPDMHVATGIKLDLPMFDKIDIESIANTYKYITKHIKKGFFVIIKGGKLEVFLPFSKHNFKNDFVERTFVSEEEKELLAEKDYHTVHKKLNNNLWQFVKETKQQPMNPDRTQWSANNCWFNASKDNFEGELHYGQFKYFLEVLTKERNIPDCAFFMNARDFPICNKDGTHPYDHLFGPDETIPVINDKQLCPIFSQSIHGGSADLLMPTVDDIERITQKYFGNKCNDQYQDKYDAKLERRWESKKTIAVFRGAATGCGITPETNPRLRLAELALEHPDLINGGITDHNAKLKKYKGAPIDVIDKSAVPAVIPGIDNVEKSKHKYIINIDGSVSAFRLSHEMGMNSVILLVESKYRMWFSHLMKDKREFILVKADLSDLVEKIQWCKDNDDACRAIANNAQAFYQKHLSKRAILDYMKDQLTYVSGSMVMGRPALCLPLMSTKKVAMISCYRDTPDKSRSRQGVEFLNIATRFYSNISPNIDIYIVTQGDNLKFNIGMLKNIGFQLACREKDYDNFIFTDIDMIPDHDLTPYIMHTPKTIMSLATRGTRWGNKESRSFLGGMISVNKDVFKDMNGYPNNFYGWGGEDDALLDRLILSGHTDAEKPAVGAVIDLESYISSMEKIENLRRNKAIEPHKFEKLEDNFTTWQDNGLNSLLYETQETINHENIMEVIVNLTPSFKPYDSKVMTSEEFKAYKKKVTYQRKEEIFKKINQVVISLD